LLVVARNSTYAYKGKAIDVRQVGKELGDIETERRADEGLPIAGFASQLRGQLKFCRGVRHAACGAHDDDSASLHVSHPRR
jgi:hypothetical protein